MRQASPRGRPGRAATRLRRVRAMLVALAAVAGCASVKDETEAIFGRGDGLEAALRGTGSAATGTVRIVDFRDGVALADVAVQRAAGHVPDRAARARQLLVAQSLLRRARVGAARLGRTPETLLPQFYVDTERTSSSTSRTSRARASPDRCR